MYPQQMYQQQQMQQPTPPPPKRGVSPWVWIGAIAAVIVALCLAVSLVTDPPKSRAPKVAAPAAVTTTAAVGSVSSASDFTGPDRAFLATLTNAAVKAGNSSVDLVNMGRKICPRIEASGKERALSILMDAGFSTVQATDVLYAAVVAYCPDQLSGVR